jgi:hypothetical protein
LVLRLRPWDKIFTETFFVGSLLTLEDIPGLDATFVSVGKPQRLLAAVWVMWSMGKRQQGEKSSRAPKISNISSEAMGK